MHDEAIRAPANLEIRATQRARFAKSANDWPGRKKILPKYRIERIIINLEAAQPLVLSKMVQYHAVFATLLINMLDEFVDLVLKIQLLQKNPRV